MSDDASTITATPSHLILHVSSTDDTIAFYREVFGAKATDDHTFSDPSLDAIFGRAGVVIRSTFLVAGGYRIHTIETLDEARPRRPEATGPPGLGLTGLSFEVDGLDRVHERTAAAGLGPTPIYEFHTDLMDHTARMFFLRDPDGIRLELIENS
jgi:catechol 2,3-dioxygenase-like lactoylglutathione lyase family enzyme